MAHPLFSLQTPAFRSTIIFTNVGDALFVAVRGDAGPPAHLRRTTKLHSRHVCPKCIGSVRDPEMKTITYILFSAMITAVSIAADPPQQTASPFEGLTETEIVKKLGPPDLTTNHTARMLYANAEKSSPVAKALAEIIRLSPDKDVQIKTIAWQKQGFRMARMVKRGENWVVFGVEEISAGWDEDARTPNTSDAIRQPADGLPKPSR